MSVAAVLERQPNVRDFGEAPVLMEKPVWERVPEEEILNGLASSWAHLPFLVDNIYERNFSSGMADYFNNLANANNPNSVKDPVAQQLKSYLFLSQKANSKLYAGDLSTDLANDEVYEIGKDTIQLILREHYRVGANLSENLDFLFWFKVCFSSEEIGPAVESLFRYNQLNPNKIDFHSDDVVASKLRGFAQARILYPEKYEGTDFKSLGIFEDGIQRALSALEIGGAEMATAIGLSAYLKVLAADKAVLGPRGIELTMPEKGLSISTSPSMPAVRRFD